MTYHWTVRFRSDTKLADALRRLQHAVPSLNVLATHEDMAGGIHHFTTNDPGREGRQEARRSLLMEGVYLVECLPSCWLRALDESRPTG